MEETTTAERTVPEIISHIAAVFLIYIFAGIIAAFAGYFFADRLSGGFLYIPAVTAGIMQAADYIAFICGILRSTIIQCALLFAGGLLIHPLVIPCAVSLYRGFCIGYVLCLHRSSLIYHSHTAVFLSLYFIATVFLFLFSSWSAARMKYRVQRYSLPGMTYGKIYLSGFLCISGIVFLLYCIPFFLP